MTILVTVVGTMASLIVSSMFAYGLIQKDVPGMSVMMVLLVITMLFNGGMTSSYVVWNNYMHISDTFLALILPNLLMNTFYVILLSAGFRGIPSEIMDASRIDGAGELTVCFRIVLPLAKPILATIGLMAAMIYMNDFSNGLYYISERRSDLYTVSLLLNKMQENIMFLQRNPGMAQDIEVPSATVRMAVCVAGVLPMLIAFPFFQRFFAKGLVLGGVKG